MALKLGTQTGSFFNHMMSAGQALPEVGKGATKLYWTDREAYFVNSVSEDKKTCIIERPEVVRADKNGMSDDQAYEYKREEGAEQITLKFRYKKWWIEYNCPHENKKKYSKINIAFGFMREYYDFSF